MRLTSGLRFSQALERSLLDAVFASGRNRPLRSAQRLAESLGWKLDLGAAQSPACPCPLDLPARSAVICCGCPKTLIQTVVPSCTPFPRGESGPHRTGKGVPQTQAKRTLGCWGAAEPRHPHPSPRAQDLILQSRPVPRRRRPGPAAPGSHTCRFWEKHGQLCECSHSWEGPGRSPC